ncbi:MAG: M48 family metalloprotease [Coriobacteriia bacterium]|nr:M48 family metalloprotease [Coriobacteriia bacterium]
MPADPIRDRSAMFDRFEPLPERAQRNRKRLRNFLVVYVALSSVLVVLALHASVFLVLLFGGYQAGVSVLLGSLSWFIGRFPAIFFMTWAVCAVLFGIFCLRRVRQREAALLGRLRAIPVPTGSYPVAKSALHDAAIVSGMPVPRLALIPDGSVNAFVIAYTPQTAWIGVTNGLLDRLSESELRCVFTHLIARVRDGSARTATVLAELFGAASEVGSAADGLLQERDDNPSDGSLLYRAIRTCFGITSFFVLAGYRRAQAVNAECADSEGMLLAKDPEAMLGALEKVLPADNRPGSISEPRFRDDLFGALFFAWPAFSFNDDPELVRIQRMREVLGAAGA